MTKFVITKNGNTLTHIPAFTTRSQAEEYIIAIGGEGYEVAEAFDVTPVTLEHALTENEILKAENAILKSETERLSTAFSGVREYIQASINRGEWEDELDEIFWHELALKLGLDLQLTEEIEVTFTATYSAWVTVPKNTDITELEIDLAWHPDVTLNGDGVGSANQDNLEVDPA
jgi:hypothetical protein